MKAKTLIGYLDAEPDADVLIYDASTDDSLPVDRVERKQGQPIVLHAKGAEDDATKGFS